MKLSKAFIPTLKETPAEAETPGHQLMLRAGLIRPLAAGVYSYLPLGWRVLLKAANIIREEMDGIGGQEFFLPALNPIEIWEQTGRAEGFGDDMFRLRDRKGRQLCLAPTHEEIIGHIVRSELRSYRDLPQIWYQIQTKFRDEPRPRSAVLRARQFIMKDSYSLDVDEAGLDRSYQSHLEAYKRIFTRCGLDFFIVGASSGLMGGTGSQEFMVASPSGEDTAALCDRCGYAANIEVASSIAERLEIQDADPVEVYTPGKRSIEEVSRFLGLPSERLMKSLMYMADDEPVAILLRGDHEANESKLASIFGTKFRPARPEEVLALAKANIGFIGPMGLEGVRTVADLALKDQGGFTTGANKDDYHIKGIFPGRDFPVHSYEDVRTVKGGEGCPNCGQPLRVGAAIEVGHIFKLGTKYSESLGATFLDAKGEKRPIVMGSYGIGLERIMASAIEQNHDEHGIVWPLSIAPYQIHILPVNPFHDETSQVAEELYRGLLAVGCEVLIDDRNERAGAKFKDADLIGIPIRVTIGQRGLEEGKVEIRLRATGEVISTPKSEALTKARQLLDKLRGKS